MKDAIGWISSIILLMTLGRQVYKQWHEGTSEGVSGWLFIGQIAASSGFALYSWQVGNWIFIVTNTLMIVNGVLGYLIVLRHRRRAARPQRNTGPLEPLEARGFT